MSGEPRTVTVRDHDQWRSNGSPAPYDPEIDQLLEELRRIEEELAEEDL